MQQRQHILQLIAEPESSAGLVRTAPAPDPTTECLVQQPPIHQEIERIVRRLDLDRAENVVPESARACNRSVALLEARIPIRERCGGRWVAAPPEHKRDAAHFPPT